MWAGLCPQWAGSNGSRAEATGLASVSTATRAVVAPVPGIERGAGTVGEMVEADRNPNADPVAFECGRRAGV